MDFHVSELIALFAGFEEFGLSDIYFSSGCIFVIVVLVDTYG